MSDMENSYLLSYSAIFGTGTPTSQWCYPDQMVHISYTVPSRSGYNFLGWAKSSTATSPQYYPASHYAFGDIFDTLGDRTLYAVWEVAWVAPRITNVSVYRSDASKNASDDGTYITVKFNWATDNAVTTCRASVNGTWQSLTAGGTKSGSVSQVLSGTYSAESSYTVSINVADSTGGSTVSATVPAAHYIMDVSKVGAVGVNTVANSSMKCMDIAMPVSTTTDMDVGGSLHVNGNIRSVGGATFTGGLVNTPITSTGEMTIMANNANSYIKINNATIANDFVIANRIGTNGIEWYGGKLGGMCGALLWSGTLSKGGSVTVSGLSKYRVVAVMFSQIASAAVGFIRSDSVYFTCATSVDDSYTTYGIRASFQRNSTTGTYVTLRSASQHVQGSTQGANLTVTSIIGII